MLTNVFKSSNIDDVVANEHKKHIKNAEENEVKMMQKTQQKIFWNFQKNVLTKYCSLCYNKVVLEPWERLQHIEK